jgi:cell division protein FtsI (penicillin-binding protein 3)
MATPPLAPLSKSLNRLTVLGLVLCVWALALVIRLFQLQVLGHEKYAHIADTQQQKLDSMDAPRGAILDRNGNYLAISSEVPIVCVNPLRIPDRETGADLLASVLNLDRDELLDSLDRAADSHRGYLVIDPQATDQEVDAVRKLNLDWVEIRQGNARSYPNGQLAAHVLGNVNSLGKGVAGIEKKLESELGGTPGLIRVTTDVHRRGYNFEVERQPIVGKNITLTIDSRLQYIAEKAIAEAVTAKHAVRGSIVAMDPYTGEVLALANYPTYNPNDRLKAGQKVRGREDFAVVAPYEPGSVFKVITLASALETTSLRPDTLINCGNGILRIGKRVIHDEHRYSILPMQDVLAHSSNIGAIRVGLTVGENNLYDYVKKFGFGRRTGIELPAEAPGLIRPLSRWRSGSLPSISMGHEVSVTTVQLAQACSVIANGGYLLHPHLVKSKQSANGEKEVTPQAQGVRALRPETVFKMRQMMEHVVVAGTGEKAHVLGYTTGGKTGTAQIFDFDHHVYTHSYNASFMGFAPVTNPSIVVVATVSGTTGLAGMAAQASAPPFRTVMAEALRLRGVPRDLPDELEEENADKNKKPDTRKKHPKPETESDLSIAELSEPLTVEDEEAALGDAANEATASILAANVVSGPTAPNFIGKTMKAVIEQAAEEGLHLETKGRGLARAQRPAPGEPMAPGERIRVLFTR